MSKQDGGPAFPLHFILDPDRGASGMYIDNDDAGVPIGMTLRDYFAGQALTGILGSWPQSEALHPTSSVEAAYEFADAMLAAREAK